MSDVLVLIGVKNMTPSQYIYLIKFYFILTIDTFLKVAAYEDEVLTLKKISRSDMGAYLCIASNGVPSSISKRIVIKVHCK